MQLQMTTNQLSKQTTWQLDQKSFQAPNLLSELNAGQMMGTDELCKPKASSEKPSTWNPCGHSEGSPLAPVLVSVVLVSTGQWCVGIEGLESQEWPKTDSSGRKPAAGFDQS